MANATNLPSVPDGAEALKDFQLSQEGIARKSDSAYGRALARQIASTLGETAGYYARRNARFQKNRAIAQGRLDIHAMFKDYLEMGKGDNYVNLSWKCIMLGNRIVSGLVGRWMGRGEKVVVTAQDSLSLRQKREQYEAIEFVMENRALLEQLQAESGVPLIPAEDIPEDQQGLHLWSTQIQKLPEEICYEMGCNDALSANGLFDAVKEKLCHDAAEVGFVGTFTWMDESGVVHTEWVRPENAIYSRSDYDDFRDTTYRGQVKALKLSELRARYPHLSEQELWEIASSAREYAATDQITQWDESWVSALTRPYDEWTVEVIDFEFKTRDTESWTKVVTKKNRSTLLKRGRPQKVADNEEVLEDTKWNIYRGVYLKDSDKMLEWGLKVNMIRPQDPKEIGNAEFSYSFYMPQAADGFNLAVPEKIEEALEGMILTRLKIQQLVAKMTPAGAAIDVDAMQELDLGLGKLTTPDEAAKIWQQTGRLYYRGRDAEGRPIPVPIQELQNTGFVGQMTALINLYQFHYSVLRDELGEDPNMLSQALQPRVAAQNVQTSQSVAENATDFYYRAVTRVLGDTAAKVACLLKDSVVYGSTVYRSLLDKGDVDGRIFSTRIDLLPTEADIQRFEQWMHAGIAANPDLILFVSPMQLLRVARENVKLAEELFNQQTRKLLRHKQAEARANMEQTIQGQIQSGQAAEQARMQTEALIQQGELQKAKAQGEAQNKSAVISMVTGLLGKGVPVPAELKPLVNAVVESLILPMVVQTEEGKAALIEQMQASEQAMQAGTEGMAPLASGTPSQEFINQNEPV